MRTQYLPTTFWFISHIRAFFVALGELVRNPIASLMTLAVIGVAMALPAGLFIMLHNFQDLSTNWNGAPTISLYLQPNVSNLQITQIQSQLKTMPNVAKIRYISPQAGLKEFEQTTQIGSSLSDLKNNPLPGVFVIYPSTHAQSPMDLKMMLQRLKQLPGVNVGQLDMAWIKRLYYILQISQRIIYSLSVLFGVGVLLIVGNTIRLAMQNHRNEITVLRLIGAKASFIRRPLLYRGILYGFFGGLIACFLVWFMLWWLETPAQALAASYDNQLIINGLSFSAAMMIILCCTVLGWLGSLFAVGKHLKSVEEV